MAQLEGEKGWGISAPSSIFTSRLQAFPDPVDGKIGTLPFLEGAGEVVALVERLGKVFAPVRYDMNGNIQKITSKYNEDTKKFEFLNDMLICEQAEGGVRTTDALLWLRRALQFFHNFLLSILEDTKSNKRPEDLTENIQKSYRETLQKYHGFIAQRLFNVLSKMVPSRTQLLKAFSVDNQDSEEVIFREIEKFLDNLNSNLIVLAKFYEDFKLNPPEPSNT